MAEGTSTTGSKKAVPDTVVELVDVAIYTFGCQSGLRLSHKIRGDPVLEGVACFLGQLLQTSNPETQEMFATISPDRFGGWTPGERPSKQLVTFISSRMKTLKTKQALREDENPQVPSRLVETREVYDGHEERVVTRYRPRCWRCGQRCDFCRQQKKNYPTFGNFRVDIASPFLDVLEGMLAEEVQENDSDEGESGNEEEMDTGEEDMINYRKCISGEDFGADDSEEESQEQPQGKGEEDGDNDDSADLFSDEED